MTRDEIYAEIQNTLGLVPKTFQSVPDAFLEQEWNTWKTSMMVESSIPDKWRELLILAMEAVAGDDYGVYYRTETARMYGATDDELRDVAYLAKLNMGWGPFMRAQQFDMGEFKREVDQMIDFARSKGETRQEAA